MQTQLLPLKVEPEPGSHPIIVRRVSQLIHGQTTLDSAEQQLLHGLPDSFVYRGGHHLSVHFHSGSARRLALVTEAVPWSFYGVDTTEDIARTWRRSLERGHCPWCNRAIANRYNNLKKHLTACPRRPA